MLTFVCAPIYRFSQEQEHELFLVIRAGNFSFAVKMVKVYGKRKSWLIAELLTACFILAWVRKFSMRQWPPRSLMVHELKDIFLHDRHLLVLGQVSTCLMFFLAKSVRAAPGYGESRYLARACRRLSWGANIQNENHSGENAIAGAPTKCFRFSIHLKKKKKKLKVFKWHICF